MGELSHQALWNKWNSGGGPKYPHEKAIQFVFRTFPRSGRSQLRMLDLGCGSGVHTQFLVAEGFDAAARDISTVGVSNTLSRLASAGLTCDVAVGGVDAIDFADDTFDGVISIGVLDCAGLRVFPLAVREIVRVLKPGGTAMLVFASDADFRVQAANEYGLHGFTDAEVAEARSLVAGELEFFWMDRYITTYQNKQLQQNDHLLTLRKATR